MNLVKLVKVDYGFQVFIDGVAFKDFYDFAYESTDAWAVYTTLRALAKARAIELECDPETEERYKEQPVPFMGPAGPMGMTGKAGECKCEERVAKMERIIKTLVKSK